MSYQNVETTAPKTLGRYELIGLLAVGGMAEIHLARLAGEAGFEKIVVVKRLLPELVASKAYVAMFLDEGKLVARLDHPNICEVHELGREGAEYFLVMPYLDGLAATELIAQPRDPDRIAQLRVATGVVVQACAGLEHAHGEVEGLVHRDVSPSNLFVTTKGVTKVLDFGIAKVTGATATEVGTVKGKTQYMAPEQVMGDPLDRRCDVFALGIVLYELCTHQRLFKRSSEYLSAKAILEDVIPRADEADPAIPRALADVIAKALARAPAERYGSAKELAAAIEGAMATHGGVARADEVAVALAAHHAEELTAQRTRQQRVVKSAVERRGDSATSPATRAATRAALLEVATTGLRAAMVAGSGSGSGSASASASDPRSGAGSASVSVSDPGSDSASVSVSAPDSGSGSGSGSGSASASPSTPASASASAPAPASASASGPVSDSDSDSVSGSGSGTNSESDSDSVSVSGSGTDSRARSHRVAWFVGVGLLAAAAIAVPLVASEHAATQVGPTRGEPKIAPTPTPTPAAPIESVPEPIAQEPPKPTPPRITQHRIAPPGTGFFSIDAHPFAEIYIDGQKLGVTPLVHKPLPAGVHHVRAVRSDGTAKQLDVTIVEGRTSVPAFTW
ncbi:MAG TPA: serine/threonine-protein kinase [Kofleriaceae bacterium]